MKTHYIRSLLTIIFVANITTTYSAHDPAHDTQQRQTIDATITDFHNALRLCNVQRVQEILRSLNAADKLAVINAPYTSIMTNTTYNSALCWMLYCVAYGRGFTTDQRKLNASMIRLLLENHKDIIRSEQRLTIVTHGLIPRRVHHLHYIITGLHNHYDLTPPNIEIYCGIVDDLISYGACLDARNEDLRTPLEQARHYLACEHHNRALLEAIIARLENATDRARGARDQQVLAQRQAGQSANTTAAPAAAAASVIALSVPALVSQVITRS